MTIKEYREFFLRAVQVFTGTKKDQELNYPTKYTVSIDGKDTIVGNRLLVGHYPSENTFKKLLESITFKLNPEDSATETQQGLVSLATDAEYNAGTNTDTNGFPLTVKPSQVKGSIGLLVTSISNLNISLQALINKLPRFIYWDKEIVSSTGLAIETIKTILIDNVLTTNGDKYEIDINFNIKGSTNANMLTITDICNIKGDTGIGSVVEFSLHLTYQRFTSTLARVTVKSFGTTFSTGLSFNNLITELFLTGIDFTLPFELILESVSNDLLDKAVTVNDINISYIPYNPYNPI